MHHTCHKTFRAHPPLTGAHSISTGTVLVCLPALCGLYCMPCTVRLVGVPVQALCRLALRDGNVQWEGGQREAKTNRRCSSLSTLLTRTLSAQHTASIKQMPHRTSGDIRATWASFTRNLETAVPYLAAKNPLSGPSCWVRKKIASIYRPCER